MCASNLKQPSFFEIYKQHGKNVPKAKTKIESAAIKFQFRLLQENIEAEIGRSVILVLISISLVHLENGDG